MRGFVARQLILSAFDVIGPVAERKSPALRSLAEVGDAGADDVTVGQSAETGGVADALALEHLHVQIELQPGRQLHAEIRAESVRARGGAARIETERTALYVECTRDWFWSTKVYLAPNHCGTSSGASSALAVPVQASRADSASGTDFFMRAFGMVDKQKAALWRPLVRMAWPAYGISRGARPACGRSR